MSSRPGGHEGRKEPNMITLFLTEGRPGEPDTLWGHTDDFDYALEIAQFILDSTDNLDRFFVQEIDENRNTKEMSLRRFCKREGLHKRTFDERLNIK